MAGDGGPSDVYGWRNCRRSPGSSFPLEPALDGVEEANELLMAMALHVAADYCAVNIECGEQRCACRVACSRGSWFRREPFFSGRPGLVRSSAGIWLFSSRDRTMA